MKGAAEKLLEDQLLKQASAKQDEEFKMRDKVREKAIQEQQAHDQAASPSLPNQAVAPKPQEDIGEQVQLPSIFSTAQAVAAQTIKLKQEVDEAKQASFERILIDEARLQ